jgi:hypothetical protein
MLCGHGITYGISRAAAARVCARLVAFRSNSASFSAEISSISSSSAAAEISSVCMH